MRGMARIAIVVFGLLLAAAAVPAGAAARGPEETVAFYLHAPGHEFRHVLGVSVLPRQGGAVVFTEESDSDTENDRGVAYAMRIPKGPLGDRLNIHFPGLGRISGRIVGGKSSGKPACSKDRQEDATFLGRIEFRGAGGYGRWRAHRAEGLITRTCGEGIKPPKTAFGYLSGYGPELVGGGDGPTSFLQAVNTRGGAAGVVFTAEVDGRGPEETTAFTVSDYEWLDGGIAVERWASRRGVPRGDLFEIAPGGRRPPTATIRPPAPFSGEATYSREGNTLLGDLSVHLLGKTVRIAGSHTEAALANST
jgi:hypothetical protein